FQVLGQLVSLAYNATAAEFAAALDLILNPSNDKPNQPHTSNFTVSRIGNVFMVIFRGAHSTASIDPSTLVSRPAAGLASIETRLSGLNYYGYETVNLTLGSGNDTLNVRSTATG
ncbi:MAG: hypothetical protein ACK58T_23390, partial [Phycisphaerae bacterium]